MDQTVGHSSAQDLDQALLFLSSFATFVLALGFGLAFKPNLLQLSILLPPLVVVGVMPLYVGYMRGTVEKRSLGEKARGWVYLLFGFAWYSITVVDAPVVLGSDLLLKNLALIVVVPLLVAVLGFIRRFVVWFYKVQGATTIPVSDKIGMFSVVSGLFMSSLFYQVVLGVPQGRTLNNQPLVYDPFTAQLVSIGEGVTFLLPLILLEVKSHHCLEEAANLFKKSRARVTLPANAPKWIIGLMDAVYLVLFPLLLGFGARASKRFLFSIAGSLALVLTGIFSSAFIGSLGALVLFIGDLALLVSFRAHFREIWRGTSPSKPISSV